MNCEIKLDIVIVPESSEVFSISSVQVPNVITQGKSIEEAKHRLKEALGLYFEEMPKEREKIIQLGKEETRIPMISRMFL
ncbi:MAG: type II toxin-antitoxin system HicB family antitoxin [Nanoarchaeota archaeon]